MQVVARSAKKARTFEIQRLVRKLRPKSTNGRPGPIVAEEGTLDTQFQPILLALKNLDIERLAAQALASRLLKDKSGLIDLREVQTYLRSIQGSSEDPLSAGGKAQNRVLASKVLVESLDQTLAALRVKAGLSVQTHAESLQTKKRKLTQQPKKEVKPSAKVLYKLQATEEPPPVASGSQTSSSSSAPDSGDIDESEDDDDITVSHISEEDAMPSVTDNIRNLDRHAISQSEASSDEEAASSIASSSFDASSKPLPTEMLARKGKAVRTLPLTTSAFLPSLAGGYTLGDSDGSVYSLSDEDGTGSAKMQRKNRRGQRARQMWVQQSAYIFKLIMKTIQRQQYLGAEIWKKC